MVPGSFDALPDTCDPSCFNVIDVLCTEKQIRAVEFGIAVVRHLFDANASHLPGVEFRKYLGALSVV